MTKHFLYNTLLNIGLILMVMAAIAAYNTETQNSEKYLILGITVLIIGLLGYLKFRLLKQVRKLTKRD